MLTKPRPKFVSRIPWPDRYLVVYLCFSALPDEAEKYSEALETFRLGECRRWRFWPTSSTVTIFASKQIGCWCREISPAGWFTSVGWHFTTFSTWWPPRNWQLCRLLCCWISYEIVSWKGRTRLLLSAIREGWEWELEPISSIFHDAWSDIPEKCFVNLTAPSEAAFTLIQELELTSFESRKLQRIVKMSGMFCIKLSLVLVIFMFAPRSAVNNFWKFFAGSAYVCMWDLSTVTSLKFGSNLLFVVQSLRSTDVNAPCL